MNDLVLDNVSKQFVEPDGTVVHALTEISARIPSGQFVMLIGANGSGKSTLLNLIAGEYAPTGGAVRFVSDAPSRRRPPTPIMIRQDPNLGSVADFSVLENMCFASTQGAPSLLVPALNRNSRAQAHTALAGSPLAAKVNALAADLSQGQRQLLAIEMCMARSSACLLADEPTASLDRTNSDTCFGRLAELSRAAGVTVVAVTHDLRAAATFGDRIVVLRSGQIHADVAGGEKHNLGPAELGELCGH